MTDVVTVPESVRLELDGAIERLAAGASHWAALTPGQRAAVIRSTHQTIGHQAEAWVAAATVEQAADEHAQSEEWLSGPYAVLSTFLATAESLELLDSGQSPAAALQDGIAPGGRTTLRVLPTTRQEQLLFHGFHAEVWLQPGITVSMARAAAGLAARHHHSGGAALVLGAGNVTNIGPLDVLYQLVAHNRASVLKVNPTFARMLEVYRVALAPLIAADLLHIVTGDAEVGGYLAHHPGITHVHLTGSATTHDALVWGTDDEAAVRRAAGTPLLTKSITSELGGVSPAIVFPGHWSRADLRFQAEQLVTQRLHNAGHNCIATQLLILSSEWAQRKEFLGAVRHVLATAPSRAPWYPGSERRLAAADDSYPGAEIRGGRRLVEVTADRPEELFRVEYFGPVLGHTTVPGSGAAFFRRAVDFANTRLAGSLGASIVIAPKDRRTLGAAFDTILADLHYGGIGVNVWSAFASICASAVWGAYPGNTLTAVGSGIGVVHNSRLLADTERTVVSGPFRPFPRSLVGGEWALWPKPPWLITARTGRETNRRLAAYAAQPTWSRLLAILPQAYRA